MKITVLTDNKVRRRGFIAEHGLSLFIEHDHTYTLFDTGQSDLFIKNAVKSNIDLHNTDQVIISHGHYDHGDGVKFLPKLAKAPKVYIQQKAFADKFAYNDQESSYRNVSFENSRVENEYTIIDGNVKINENMTLLTNIPHTVLFEDIPKGFFISTDAGMIADELVDEQLLVIETKRGLFIFIGCAHPGIINCLSYVKKEFPNVPIDTVVAGMHLEKVDDERLSYTINALEKMHIKHLIPLHCTGLMAIAAMKKVFKERCIILNTGDPIDI